MVLVLADPVLADLVVLEELMVVPDVALADQMVRVPVQVDLAEANVGRVGWVADRAVPTVVDAGQVVRAEVQEWA